jgi:hypothetical protein
MVSAWVYLVGKVNFMPVEKRWAFSSPPTYPFRLRHLPNHRPSDQLSPAIVAERDMLLNRSTSIQLVVRQDS